MGWHPQIPYNALEQDNNTQQSRGHSRVTMREFLAYRLHIRENESNHIFCSGKLFFEYLVDSWAICEQERLSYIRHNPGRLRMDLYSDLTTAIEQNPQLNHAQIGTKVILPSTFTSRMLLLSIVILEVQIFSSL